MRVAVVQTQWVDDHEDGLRNAHRAIEDVCSGGDIDLVCFPEFCSARPGTCRARTA